MKDTFLEELRSCDLHALSEISRKTSAREVEHILRKGHADTLEEFANARSRLFTGSDSATFCL